MTISSRIDRLEQQLGNPEQDMCRLLEILRATADGVDIPYVVTPGMRQILVQQLIALDVGEQEIAELSNRP